MVFHPIHKREFRLDACSRRGQIQAHGVVCFKYAWRDRSMGVRRRHFCGVPNVWVFPRIMDC